MTYEIKLDVYEGPFGLLLQLITERRVDVCDVPIAELVAGYLEHINHMRTLDLDVTTEFLVVAATLLQLKARALMPRAELADDAADQDIERDLLVSRLLEVRTFQAAGELLSGLLAEGDMRHPAAPASDDPALRVLPTLAGISAADLASSLVEMIRGMVRHIDVSLLVVDQVSTEEAMSVLTERLTRGPTTFAEMAAGQTLSWVVAVFLAMLEMSARGEVVLGQAERLGQIEIRSSEAPNRQPETHLEVP